MTNFSERIIKDSTENTRDQINGGIIGIVINYHPPKGGGSDQDGTDKKAGRCFCDRHNGERMKMYERHTVDVEIVTEKKKEIWNAVPCFMYAQGIIDHGFKKNDKVFINFINNDLAYPVAIAYYRNPKRLDNFWNSLKYSMANFVQEYVVDAFNIGDSVSADSESDSIESNESTDNV